MVDAAQSHKNLRPLMFSIAYRMLGSVAEAEDVVQDAFLKMHLSTLGGTTIESEDAFAVTVTTRLAIDVQRSARRQRELYTGSWLPEPIIEPQVADPAVLTEMDETLSIAFLVVLERLSPLERAVFLLREVFCYDYATIATTIDKSETNTRQLLTRAKNNIAAGRPRFEPSREKRFELGAAFLDAVRSGDIEQLERMLAEDVVFTADGGGKATVIGAPITGAARVAAFLSALIRQAQRMNVTVLDDAPNGQPGARVVTPEGDLISVLAFEIADGKVRSIANQVNPDKLARLQLTSPRGGPVPPR